MAFPTERVSREDHLKAELSWLTAWSAIQAAASALIAWHLSKSTLLSCMTPFEIASACVLNNKPTAIAAVALLAAGPALIAPHSRFALRILSFLVAFCLLTSAFNVLHSKWLAVDDDFARIPAALATSDWLDSCALCFVSLVCLLWSALSLRQARTRGRQPIH